MKIFKTPLKDTGFFQPLILDYVEGKQSLKEFVNVSPTPESFSSLISERAFPNQRRQLLFEVLTRQYQGVDTDEVAASNLNKLKDPNTFTVVTGHQLNLLTGPLFFVYKLLTTINLAEELSRRWPDKNFVPVYWMASEDHDFEEINHFSLFGKDYKWETSQTGPVGRFTTEGISDLLNTTSERIEIALKAYAPGKSLSKATLEIVNSLFGKYGLVVIDPDDRQLKQSFSEVIRHELKDSIVAKNAVSMTEGLKAAGYEAQVYPRDPNLFLLSGNERKRLERRGNDFIAHPDQSFTLDQLLALLDSTPEAFSPNVVLRPIYQEYSLPNIAYIGGPAEVGYWFQFKQAFDALDMPYPMLLPRNFFLFIDKSTYARMEKLKISALDAMIPLNELKQIVLSRAGVNELDLESEVHALEQIFEQVKEKAMTADKSLEKYVLAEKQKMLKEFEVIEKKIKKAEELKHDTVLRQVEKLKDKLFPNGGLQERKENIFTFLSNDPDFIEKIKANTEPFDFTFKIICDC